MVSPGIIAPSISAAVRNQAIASLAKNYSRGDIDVAVAWLAELGDHDAFRVAGHWLVTRLGSNGDIDRFGRVLESAPASLRDGFISRFAEQLLNDEDEEGDEIVAWVGTLAGLDRRHALAALEDWGVSGKTWSRLTSGGE